MASGARAAAPCAAGGRGGHKGGQRRGRAPYTPSAPVRPPLSQGHTYASISVLPNARSLVRRRTRRCKHGFCKRNSAFEMRQEICNTAARTACRRARGRRRRSRQRRYWLCGLTWLAPVLVKDDAQLPEREPAAIGRDKKLATDAPAREVSGKVAVSTHLLRVIARSAGVGKLFALRPAGRTRNHATRRGSHSRAVPSAQSGAAAGIASRTRTSGMTLDRSADGCRVAMSMP